MQVVLRALLIGLLLFSSCSRRAHRTRSRVLAAASLQNAFQTSAGFTS